VLGKNNNQPATSLNMTVEGATNKLKLN